MDSREVQCQGRAPWVLWTARKASGWVLEQMKPETSLEAKMAKLKLSPLGHLLLATVMLG